MKANGQMWCWVLAAGSIRAPGSNDIRHEFEFPGWRRRLFTAHFFIVKSERSISVTSGLEAAMLLMPTVIVRGKQQWCRVACGFVPFMIYGGNLCNSKSAFLSEGKHFNLITCSSYLLKRFKWTLTLLKLVHIINLNLHAAVRKHSFFLPLPFALGCLFIVTRRSLYSLWGSREFVIGWNHFCGFISQA